MCKEEVFINPEYQRTKDGDLLVKVSGNYREYGHEETYRLTKANRTFLNLTLAHKNIKKGNKTELGIILEDALKWFADTLLDYEETKPEYGLRKTVHFKSTDEQTIYRRDLLNRHNIINIILTLYAREHPVETSMQEQEANSLP
ncbi:MAG: hypothetical protein M1129_04050 [Candidatus Thermoplasmatota archaeon]|jgi:hypothetical protein|nr:hypothetical protein [Candidatus Thermoplasmatota archaeon]MCL5955037.1 hypothetical protein [Candidatus Thermoplasmatota archaeon]